jgi:hypothetical protein
MDLFCVAECEASCEMYLLVVTIAFTTSAYLMNLEKVTLI